MGLERLACVMQGVDNIFEVDTVQNIMKHISKIAGVEYKKDHKTDVSLRVITDHIRSTTFMVGDGIMPSNEGRGYVLRRLLLNGTGHRAYRGIHLGKERNLISGVKLGGKRTDFVGAALKGSANLTARVGKRHRVNPGQHHAGNRRNSHCHYLFHLLFLSI